EDGNIIGATCLWYALADDKIVATAFHEVLESLSQARIQARQQQDALEWFIDYCPLAILSIDAEGKVTAVNKTMLRFFPNTTQEDLLGHSYAEYLTAIGMDYRRSYTIKALQGEVSLGVRADYKGRVYDGYAYPLFDQDTWEIIGAQTTLSDVTENSRIETELLRLERLSVMGQVAASLAHELRNPMTTVRGFLQLLGEQETLYLHHPYMKLRGVTLSLTNNKENNFY
ncbi:MAG: histidine kinase dimerization/phospho-acceptor domain-containing protein, partial [bacterium]|nr:histidine kinase dimerization/phospho-acceptor domain-containing protein [bacterium]